ncbi:MAG: outer membrane beta-barrel protein [Deltaproteobacteria bacterium]|nr:outer membrane beta-barrel protein [Deltaproteobacteria bacterium]
MQKVAFITALILCSTSFTFQEDDFVVQVSKSNRSIAISKGEDSGWRAQDRFYVMRGKRKIAEGHVVRIASSRVLASVDSVKARINPGDEVVRLDESLHEGHSTANYPDFRLGIHMGWAAGASSSNTSGTTNSISGITTSSSASAAFLGGLSGEVRLLENNLFFQPELYYSPKGSISANVSIPTDYGTFSANGSTSSMTYLESYWGLKARLNSFIDPYITAGPQLSFLLSGGNNARSILFGLGAGGGLEIGLGKSVSLSFAARYVLGLTNTVEGSDSKSNTFHWLLGVQFPL